jgi:hypothetical protein
MKTQESKQTEKVAEAKVEAKSKKETTQKASIPS